MHDEDTRNDTAPKPRHAQPRVRVLQHVLIGCGITLLLAYAAAQIHAYLGAARALAAFDQAAVPAQVAAAAPGKTRGAPPGDAKAADPGVSPATTIPDELSAPAEAPDTSSWSARRIAAYQQSLLNHSDTPVGVLSIDRIGLRAPIFPGTSELALNRGLGHIEGTAALDGHPGNVGIAGHRDGFFRQLRHLEIGDAIVVQTLRGRVRYRVREILIVDPEDVHVLDPTPDHTITLVTCHPFYYVGHAPRRFIVKASAGRTAAAAALGTG